MQRLWGPCSSALVCWRGATPLPLFLPHRYKQEGHKPNESATRAEDSKNDCTPHQDLVLLPSQCVSCSLLPLQALKALLPSPFTLSYTYSILSPASQPRNDAGSCSNSDDDSFSHLHRELPSQCLGADVTNQALPGCLFSMPLCTLLEERLNGYGWRD